MVSAHEYVVMATGLVELFDRLTDTKSAIEFTGQHNVTFTMVKNWNGNELRREYLFCFIGNFTKSEILEESCKVRHNFEVEESKSIAGDQYMTYVRVQNFYNPVPFDKEEEYY